MRDTLLSPADREEALSWSYVRAVAAVAGYNIAVADLDRDSVDMWIHAGGNLRGLYT